MIFFETQKCMRSSPWLLGRGGQRLLTTILVGLLLLVGPVIAQENPATPESLVGQDENHDASPIQGLLDLLFLQSEESTVEPLAEIANNQALGDSDRLTAIAALQELPGKEPVAILVALLNDPNDSIYTCALEALNQSLALEPPISAEQFQNEVWPHLKKMSEKDFLQRQLALRTDRLRAVERQRVALENQLEQLKQHYLKTQTQWIEKISDPDEKLVALQTYLQDPGGDFLRVWVLEQINLWCASSTTSQPAQVQVLVDLLATFIGDSNRQVRRLTAKALEQLVEHSQTTAPALTEQITVEIDPQAQIAQLEALSILAYVPATPQAIRLLQADVPDVAAQSARMLGNIAVVESELNSKEQLDHISQALIGRYSRANGSAIVRREIINAIWKLASLESYQPQARTLFPEILKEALTNADGNCRSFAVRALTVLFGAEVFPFILSPTAYLLDDRESSVRFRVIEAIEKHGNANQLAQLRQRLEVEEQGDLNKSLRATFSEILQTQPTKKVYDWAQQLQQTQESQNPKELRLLANQVIDLLWKKIGEDKAQNRAVPVETELLVLMQLAKNAEQSSQPKLALSWYEKIIGLEIAEEIKQPYRQKIEAINTPEPAPVEPPVETPPAAAAPTETKAEEPVTPVPVAPVVPKATTKPVEPPAAAPVEAPATPAAS